MAIDLIAFLYKVCRVFGFAVDFDFLFAEALEQKNLRSVGFSHQVF
jgi:hypothetical protein